MKPETQCGADNIAAVATETSFQEPLLRFILGIAAQDSADGPGAEAASLLAAAPELNFGPPAAERAPRVFVSGWGEVAGVLMYRDTAPGRDNWQAVVAARDERALRDLLLAFPGRGSGVLFLCQRWMLATVRDLFTGKELPERAGYYATPGTLVPSGTAPTRRPGGRSSAVRALGDGLYEVVAPEHGEADADAVRTATADALAGGRAALALSLGADRSGTIAVFEALGYRPLYRLAVFAGARRGALRADGSDRDARMAGPQVAAKDTPAVQRLRALREPAVRRAEASFVAEGPTLVRRAMQDKLPVEAVLCLNAFAAAPEGREIADACGREGIACYRCSDGLMGTITSSRPLPAVMAAVHFRLGDVGVLRPPRSSILLVAENLQNPDNLGMVLRTADGAGAGAVVVTEDGVDPLHKNCVRAARGAVGRIPLYSCADLPGWLGELSRSGFASLGATAHADADLYAQTLDLPLAFVVGNEETGLRPETLAACTSRVRIPMAPGQSSLNVGVAAGVLLFEFVRRSGRR
jgi:RNA methyltransferase, TrmH family